MLHYEFIVTLCYTIMLLFSNCIIYYSHWACSEQLVDISRGPCAELDTLTWQNCPTWWVCPSGVCSIVRPLMVLFQLKETAILLRFILFVSDSGGEELRCPDVAHQDQPVLVCRSLPSYCKNWPSQQNSLQQWPYGAAGYSRCCGF